MNNFNYKKFLVENKLTTVSKLIKEDKSDNQYYSQLDNYLQDNQIYGYTKRIHNIMADAASFDEAYAELEQYLEDNQIYGNYKNRIADIYEDYPYHLHWKNQPEEITEYGNQDPWIDALYSALEDDYEPGTPEYEKFADYIDNQAHDDLSQFYSPSEVGLGGRDAIRHMEAELATESGLDESSKSMDDILADFEAAIKADDTEMMKAAGREVLSKLKAKAGQAMGAAKDYLEKKYVN